MNKNDIENFIVEERIDESFAISLAGIMPEVETVDFGILESSSDAGECFSVTESGEDFSFVDGCEQLINQICLVVNSVVEVAQEVITRKYKMYCERAKVTILPRRPDFLRL